MKTLAMIPLQLPRVWTPTWREGIGERAMIHPGQDAALAAIRPAALRESLASFPNVTWDEIGGLESVKQRLRQLVEDPLRRPHLWELT